MHDAVALRRDVGPARLHDIEHGVSNLEDLLEDAHAVDLDAAGGQAGDDVEEGVRDLQRVAEGHAFVFGGGAQEALPHAGLPDDEAEPLLCDEDVGFLDAGERDGCRVRAGELLLEGGVGGC